MTHQNETVVGVFLDESTAQRAIRSLQSAGFNADVADESAIRSFRNTGLEDEVIQLYESRYNEGNTIVTVNAGGRGEDALSLLLESGAEYINLHGDETPGQTRTHAHQTRGESYDANYYSKLQANQRQYGRYDESRGRARTAEEMRVQLREETLSATKQSVQAGEVELRKTVTEREQQVPVNLQHEEVVVERRAVDRPADPGEIGDMKDEVIRVPVYEEQAQLQKQARVREEVAIGKDVVQEQQTLSGTVRREDVEVVESGDVRVRGDADSNIRADRTDRPDSND